MNNTGVVLSCINNPHIEYSKLAIICALHIKQYWNIPIQLICDKYTLSQIQNLQFEEHLEALFDHIDVISTHFNYKSQTRQINDGFWHSENVLWHNHIVFESFKLAKFEKNVFVDLDFLIQSKFLLPQIENVERFAIVKNVEDVTNTNSFVPLCDKQFWSTVMVITQKEKENAFPIVQHLFENYDISSVFNGFPKSRYRNDVLFSMLWEILESGETIEYLRFLTDRDSLYRVNNDSLTFIMRPEQNKYYLKKIRTDIHAINKFSLIRKYDAFVQKFKDLKND